MNCKICKTENPSNANFCLKCGNCLIEKSTSSISKTVLLEHYQMLLNNSPWAIAVYEAVNDGKDFIFKDFNPKAEELEGVKKEDLLGKNVVDVFPGIIELGLLDVFKRVYKTGKPEHLESRLYIDTNNTAWRDNLVYKLSTGEIVAAYEDLSQKISAFKKIQETQIIFQNIFEKSNLGILCVNLERNFILTNPAFQKMLGYTNDELIKLKVDDITFPEDLELSINSINQIFVDPTKCSPYQKRYVTKKGDIVWCNLTRSVITDDDNNILYTFATTEDITEKKKLEQELLEYKNNLENLVKEKTELLEHSFEELRAKKTILDSINLIFKETLTCDTIEQVAKVCLTEAENLTKSKFGFIMKLNKNDTATSLALTNPGWAECSMVHPERFLQNMLLRGLWSIPLTENRSIICNNIPINKPEVNLPEGHPLLTDFLSVPLKLGNKVIGSIALGNKTGGYSDKDQEIIELLSIAFSECLNRKRKDDILKTQNIQLKEAHQHKNRFLSTMSHELRTPLNAILGLSQSLQKEYFGTLNEKQTEYTNLIYDSGQHLLCLINDILDIAKIEGGSMELDLEAFDAIELLKELVSLMTTQFNDKAIQLSFKPDINKILLNADKKKNRQIILNLLTNALKYTQTGGNVTIKISQENNTLKTSIIDNGAGIHQDDFDKIFDDFYQSKKTKDNAMGGAGIGLALCKRLVEIQGGEIGVESIDGKGSTFWFTMPLNKSLVKR